MISLSCNEKFYETKLSMLYLTMKIIKIILFVKDCQKVKH